MVWVRWERPRKEQWTCSGEEAAGRVAQESQARRIAPELEGTCKIDAVVSVEGGETRWKRQNRSNAQTRLADLNWPAGQNPRPNSRSSRAMTKEGGEGKRQEASS